LRKPANKQTNKSANTDENITSLAEVTIRNVSPVSEAISTFFAKQVAGNDIKIYHLKGI